MPACDGVRDVYFTGEVGGCTGLGSEISYGHDLRYELHLGGSNRKTLIRYDLTPLGPGAKAAKALLALNIYAVNGKADLNCRVYAVKKPWSGKMIDGTGGLPVSMYTRGKP